MGHTKKYQQGETVPIHAEVKDWDTDEYVDPTTIKLDIIDPTGTSKVTAQDMTQQSTGKYVYYYNTSGSSEVGWWSVKVTVTDGSGGSAKVTISPAGFSLE